LLLEFPGIKLPVGLSHVPGCNPSHWQQGFTLLRRPLYGGLIASFPALRRTISSRRALPLDLELLPEPHDFKDPKKIAFFRVLKPASKLRSVT
jgi:hypothetical protein